MIKVLSKVDEILDEIAKRDGITFSCIMEDTGIKKSTLSHLLKSMSALGWVFRTESKEYFPGEKLVNYARKTLSRESLRHALGEAVRRLAAGTGETTSASVLVGNQRVRVAKTFGAGEILVDDEGFAYGSGGILDTATGRLLTSFQPTARRSQIIKSDGREESPELIAELDEIKKTGLSRHKSAGGLVSSMACGVFSGKGRIIAATGIAVSTYHLSKKKRRNLLKNLKKRQS